MGVQGEGDVHLFDSHDFETDGIGERNRVVAKSAKPPVDRRSFKIAVDEHDFVERIGVNAIQKPMKYFFFIAVANESKVKRNRCGAEWISL